MEPLQEPINIRVTRLNSHIIGKSTPKNKNDNLSRRESLLDALLVLYDECNTDNLKKSDKNIGQFVEKYRNAVGDLKRLRVNVSDFEIKSVIGRGHFGEVHVVKEKQTGDVYAMKTIKKYDCLERGSGSFERERDIMAETQSAWLTTLQYSFQDDANLFYVMEYHPGGDLLGLLYRQGGTLPESAATFYIAEIVLALNDLHSMGYVHRDIKPDNVLLDCCGHIKLADFGSAAKLNQKGFVNEPLPAGTPDYVAPEVLLSTDNKNNKNVSYTAACDYWSLGVIAYELTVGNTPFAAQSTASTYSKIMNFKNAFKFPSDVLLSQAYVSLVKNLLIDHSKRLQYKQIIKHPLFKNIAFNCLREQVPPFVPKIVSVEDTSNFTDVHCKKNEPNVADFKRKTQFSGRNLPFIGFTYLNCDDATYNLQTPPNETNENLKREIDDLKQKQLKCESSIEETKILKKKYEDKCRKVESVENLRDQLEHDLSKSIAECTVLKRTLELERKDRTELEQKALELIKSAKQKWETSEKNKIEALNLELAEQKEKVQQLTNINCTLNEQIQHALKTETKHKISLDKVKNLNRRSVIGLESRLDKITSETSSKITEIQAKLNETINENNELEKQMNVYKKNVEKLTNELTKINENCSSWKLKYEDTQKVAKSLENKLNALEVELKQTDVYKNEIDSLKAKLLEKQCNENELDRYRSQMENEKQLNCNLQQKIEELTDVKNKALSQHDLTVEQHKKDKQQLNETVRHLTEEKINLTVKLEEANRSDENNRIKVQALEELLSRLENGISKLENGTDRESILQEQVERLEQQLVQVHQTTALEKQELTQLKTKHWRIEKELNDAKIDKRILERELKDSTEENKTLKTEIKTLNEKMNENKRNYESAILELGNLNENLADEIVKLKNLIKQLNDNVNSEKEKCDSEKSAAEALNATIKEKNNKICKLEETIEALVSEIKTIDNQIAETRNENSTLKVNLESTRIENKNIKNSLDASSRKLQNTQLNLDALREACTMLESQLIEYDKIEVARDGREREANENVERLVGELAKTKNDVQEAKKLMNEEKSLKLLAETKCKHLTEDVESLQNECTSYKQQCMEYKEYSNQLSEELTATEECLSECKMAVKALERQVEDGTAERNLLKEEHSTQLTQLHNLKESNCKLNQQLNVYKSKNFSLTRKMNELENLFQEKINYHKEREVKSLATIQQQTKLIDYLQNKLEENSKKKKTLSDKIFGSGKKENQPPTPAASRNLEQKLQNEQRLNKKLREQIEQLQAQIELNKLTQSKEELLEVPCTLNQTDIKNYNEEIIVALPENISVHCLVEIGNEKYLLGTDAGLYALHNRSMRQITGPSQVYSIIIMATVHQVLFIANQTKALLTCDLEKLTELAMHAPYSLNYKTIAGDEYGEFHIMQASNFKQNHLICAATPKQLIIFGYVRDRDMFQPLRMLDTAEPIRCLLFTDNTVIVGADKFFEVDLATFEAEEFLDVSDVKLKQAIKCYKIGSFPLGVIEVGKNSREYLLCFNEFALFVDEYGCCSRDDDVKWERVPTAFHYVQPYLYVTQLTGIEIFKIDENNCTSITRIELNSLRHLGYNKRGIFVGVGKEIKFFSADLDEDVASTVAASTVASINEEDRFSFTSSMVQSLDGNLSDLESNAGSVVEQQKRVKFSTVTDL